jgi:hypothetical protein
VGRQEAQQVQKPEGLTELRVSRGSGRRQSWHAIVRVDHSKASPVKQNVQPRSPASEGRHQVQPKSESEPCSLMVIQCLGVPQGLDKQERKGKRAEGGVGQSRAGGAQGLLSQPSPTALQDGAHRKALPCGFSRAKVLSSSSGSGLVCAWISP